MTKTDGPFSVSLPEEVFQLLGHLLPELIHVADICEVTGIEFFIMLYIRHRGTYWADKQVWCVLREEFTNLLRREFSYTPTHVDQQLQRMEEKNLLFRARLTPDEKRQLFGNDQGRKMVVILQAEGLSKIEHVKDELSSLFKKTLLSIPSVIRTPLLKVGMPAIRKAASAMVAEHRNADKLPET